MIIVTRGSGPFGRLVVRHLMDRVPAGEIAVTAPEPEQAADLAELGVDVRREHLDDPVAAAEVFAGAGRVLIVSPPGPSGDGLPAAVAFRAVDAAAAAGASRIAYTGIVNASTTHHKWHLSVEGRIKGTGVPFTFLRNNLHSEALLPAVQLALRGDELVCAFDGEVMAPAARTDYAEAAAVVLTEDGHADATYQLSGPLGLTSLGIASVISEIAGREIPVREVRSADLVAELKRSGASDEVAAELDALYEDTRMGEWSVATETLEHLLGHDRIPLVEALRSAIPVVAPSPRG
jgi:NAD(P)H dehydrogenase (quinone)